MHVLIIEPDLLLAQLYRDALELSGHSVQICAGAQTAVLAADEKTPDLVILELQLVGHSGIEFLYEFRSYSDWEHIPVIINSNVPAGEFENSWELLRHELGVRAYHYKPLTNLRALTRSLHEFAPAT